MRTALFALVLPLAACQNTPTEAADDPAPTSPGTDLSAVEALDEPTDAMPSPDEMEAMGTVPTEAVSETMPAGPERIAEGAFSGASGHDVSGTAALYRLDDGSHLVRLEGLASDNGPDLKLWLVRSTTENVGRDAVSLGPLKSTRGDQNYEVPAGTDVSAFAGVSVWCERFGVNFGTAPLR